MRKRPFVVVVWDDLLQLSVTCPKIQVSGCPRLLRRLRDLREVKGSLEEICCALETTQVRSSKPPFHRQENHLLSVGKGHDT